MRCDLHGALSALFPEQLPPGARPTRCRDGFEVTAFRIRSLGDLQ